VGRGQLDAPSTSPVRCCSWPVLAVLDVHAGGQRRDVAAALAAPAAMMALPGMEAEMGARVWRRECRVGLAKAFSTAGRRA
jgi:hypothetical protein